MAINPHSFYSTLTRRDFVKRAGGCAGLSSLSILSTILNLKMTQSAVAASGTPGDHKALVCLFAFGGMDSRNLLAPYNPGALNVGEHAGYVQIRQGLHDDATKPNGVALPRADDVVGDINWGMALKPISPKSTSPNAGREFGIHGYFNANRNEPRYQEGDTDIPPEYEVGDIIPAGQARSNLIDGSENYMQQLYNEEKLTFVCNVGSLVHPDTRWDNWTNFRPVGLFSHSDEQRNWMTAMPENQSQNIGFMGRTADMLLDRCNLNAKISMNIVMDNFRTMSIGENTLPYIITDNGAYRFLGSRYPSNNSPANRDRILTDLTNGLLTEQYTNLLELSHSTSRRDAIDAAIEYNNATSGVTLKTDDAMGYGPWPTHGLGRDMKQVAKSIIAHGPTGLKQDRQIFFLSRGGFDNHSNLIGNHNTTLPQVGETVYRFWREMEAQGLQNQVVLFSASDFERTYGPNSNKGTDHAWGSNQFIVGSPTNINGGDIVGVQPDSTDPAKFVSSTKSTRIYSTDTRGRIIPSHSVDEYMAELIKWFGDFTDSDLEYILPNYSRFRDAPGRAPIGHMAS